MHGKQVTTTFSSRTAPHGHACSSTKKRELFSHTSFRRCPFQVHQEKVSLVYPSFIRSPLPTSPRTPHIAASPTFNKVLFPHVTLFLFSLKYNADHLSFLLSGGSHKVSKLSYFLLTNINPLSRLRCMQSS